METTIYSLLRLYRDNGKENGNYSSIIVVIQGLLSGDLWGHVG